MNRSDGRGIGDDRISLQADAGVALDLARLEDCIRRAAGELPCAVSRAAFRLVDDVRMTELHRRHLDIDGTTDVLTFPQALAPAGDRAADELPAIDVDIVICVDEAARQATARGHAVDLELLLYAVHGLLHCAGFDDHDEADAHAMHAEEDRILEAIGVGAVFGRASREEESA